MSHLPVPRRKAKARLDSFANFDIPVSEIDEMLPTVVAVQAEVDLEKRTPFGALRSANEVESGFLRSAVRFAGVTHYARANDIFPSRRAAPVSRNNVIQIEIFTVENLTAILAFILVSFENVMPGKFHFLLWETIKDDQQNNPRHADLKGNGMNAFRMRLLR
jgi:hypothetical protein